MQSGVSDHAHASQPLAQHVSNLNRTKVTKKAAQVAELKNEKLNQLLAGWSDSDESSSDSDDEKSKSKSKSASTASTSTVSSLVKNAIVKKAATPLPSPSSSSSAPKPAAKPLLSDALRSKVCDQFTPHLTAELARKLEEHLYAYFHYTVGAEYKSKVRDVLSNLRDASNPDFRSGIMSGDIDVASVPAMSSADMASKEQRSKSQADSQSILADALIVEQEYHPLPLLQAKEESTHTESSSGPSLPLLADDAYTYTQHEAEEEAEPRTEDSFTHMDVHVDTEDAPALPSLTAFDEDESGERREKKKEKKLKPSLKKSSSSSDLPASPSAAAKRQTSYEKVCVFVHAYLYVCMYAFVCAHVCTFYSHIHMYTARRDTSARHVVCIATCTAPCTHTRSPALCLLQRAETHTCCL